MNGCVITTVNAKRMAKRDDVKEKTDTIMKCY